MQEKLAKLPRNPLPGGFENLGSLVLVTACWDRSQRDPFQSSAIVPFDSVATYVERLIERASAPMRLRNAPKLMRVVAATMKPAEEFDVTIVTWDDGHEVELWNAESEPESSERIAATA